MKPVYWTEACQELSTRDPIMANIIARYPGEILSSRGDPFETLLRSIVGQQISVKAAQSVWERTRAALDAQVTPVQLLMTATERLRGSGLSQRKVEYARDLAQHFVDHAIEPGRWDHLDDEAIIAELCDVRGIGRWTAEMFLIFHLLRPNVFPEADLGLQKGIATLYGKRYPLGPRVLARYRKLYDPWASVATWYLWRSLDPIPVEY